MGGRPKISLSFFSSPVPFSLFLSLSVCLLVEFWWCLKRWGDQMCTFGVLWLSCETPAALGPPGFHMTTRELQTCKFESPGASKTPPKFNEKTARERDKKSENGAGKGKKERHFGRSGGGWGGSKPTTTHTNTNHNTTQQKWIAKNGLAKLDWPKSAITDF